MQKGALLVSGICSLMMYPHPSHSCSHNHNTEFPLPLTLHCILCMLVLLREGEEVGVHLSTIPRLSATGTPQSESSNLFQDFNKMVIFLGHRPRLRPQKMNTFCLSSSEFLGKPPGSSVQRWVPSRSTRRDVNASNEKERHDAIFRKVRGYVFPERLSSGQELFHTCCGVCWKCLVCTLILHFNCL